MGTSGSASDAAREDLRRVFSSLDEPSTPLTTAEIAERLERPEPATREDLSAVADRGALGTRELADGTRLWWWADRDEPTDQGADLDELGAFVRSVEDYAIFALDPDGVVVSWNEGAERIKGYAEAEIVGEHFSTFYVDGDVDEGVPEANLEVAARTGRVENEGWRVRADGSRFWANVVITAIRDEDGELQGFTKVTRDMTEQRTYERRLRQERDLTDRILETVPVSISLIDAAGSFVRVNQRTLERLGLEEDALSEYDVDSWDIYDEAGDPIPVDERPWSRALETGTAISDFECQVDLPDAGRRWLSINAVPIGDEYANVDREGDEYADGDRERDEYADLADANGEMVVLAVDDVTDQKERERQLRRESTQTEKLLRTAPMAVAVQNTEGETVLANDRAQEALGLSERELIEEPDDAEEWDVYDADGNQLDDDELPPARALATGEPVYDEELVIDPPEDERMQFRLNAAPVFGPDGSIERVVTAGEDVTELKKRQRQLERRKTELETELSEILGRISDAFYALDDEYRFTHLNDRAAEIMQRSRDELLGQTIWEAFPDAATVYREQFETAMETQDPVGFEVHVEAIDAWLEFNAYPSETGLSIYFRDVTERKEREERLTKYETIVETISDGIYVKDDDGYFTMVNDAYAEMTGYDREELLGEHASLVVDEDTIEQSKERKAETAADGETDPTMEAPIRTAEGDLVPAEATFATIRTDDGDVEQVGVVRDVSERKEYERRIEESERRYRTLAENFPNGIVALFDEDLRYVAAGGELMGAIGIDSEGAVGQTIYERYPDDLVAEVEPYFTAALDGEEDSFEVSLYGRDLLAHTLPIGTTGEGRTGMLVVQDVTERREYERKLEESNERLEQFAYAASHDLQEPLRMVTSYLKLIERRYADELDADGEEFIDFAVDGAERMREMIDGLLEYSRVETQGDPFEPVDLDAVLSAVRDDLQIQIEESGAEITAEALPTVAGDAGQLRQVFQNLLDNAIEYSGDGPPRVSLAAERDGEHWRVSVRDEGIGIDPDDSERVFEVFQRLHGQEEHAGTGIGLALCRRIVERHGGDIWVDSEPGTGATFSFTLPAVGGSDE